MSEGISMASLVYLKHKNGTTYVYENVSYWDKKSKKQNQKRKCIGHLDRKPEQCSQMACVAAIRKILRPKSEKEPPKCFTYSCGVSSLLDKVCADIGLGHILKRSFPNDWDAILTCAYYLVSEGQALSRAEKWSRQAVTPYGTVLADQRISELLIRITPELVQGFFQHGWNIIAVTGITAWTSQAFPPIVR